MKKSVLRDEFIKDVVQDTSFTDDEIDVLIDRALKAANKICMFPALETLGTVTTDPLLYEVDLPSDFGHNLYYVTSPTGKVEVFVSLELLFLKHPNVDSSELTAGDVESCAVRAGKLLYYPTPSVATVLPLRYYTNPGTLKSSVDLDLYIESEDDQELVLGSHVLWKLYGKIEDGEEGDRPNTLYYKALYDQHVALLAKKTKRGQSRPQTIKRSDWI